MMLKGIRVVDFSQYLPGPFASLRLAEMGAEVIKVEPRIGDPSRFFGEKVLDTDPVFQANNYRKKSIALNLKHEEGQRIARELMKTADIVIESFRPGVMKRLGLDYERIKKEKEDIIYCAITGYGQQGEMSSFGSHDLNYMSVTGVLSQIMDQNHRPVIPSITFADLIGGITANEAIVTALFYKGKTGKGQYIDLSITDSLLAMMNTHIEIEKRRGYKWGVPFLKGEIISYNVYETKDGRYVSLAALEPKFWENFCKATAHEEWLTSHYSKATNENEVHQQVVQLFKSKTYKEWTQFGFVVDCCLTPILETNELDNKVYISRRKEGAGDHRKAPRLGEHTEEILVDLLNKDEQKVALLKKLGVI